MEAQKGVVFVFVAAAVATSGVLGVPCFDLSFFLLPFLLLSLVLVVLLFLLDASPGGLPGGGFTIVGSSFTRVGALRCC